MADVMDAETKTTWFSWNKRELEKVRHHLTARQQQHTYQHQVCNARLNRNAPEGSAVPMLR